MPETEAIVLLNDKELPSGQLEDLQPFKGIDLYEVIRVVKGMPIFTEDHLERLAHSFQLAGADTPENFETIQERINRLIRINRVSEGNIRIDAYLSEGHSDLLLQFVPHYYPHEEEYSKGVKLIFFRAERENPNAKIMRTEMKDSIAAKLKETGAYEALLVNSSGRITEGSKSNLFAIRGQALFTPPASEVLQGITMKHVVEICRQHSLTCFEQSLFIADLPMFDALFITGTSPKLLPACCLEQYSFDPSNNLLRSLMGWYDERIAQYLHTASGKTSGNY